MKITATILLVTCLHVCGKGISQTVTLSEKNAPLQKIFKAIESQTDFVFFTDFSLLNHAKLVTIDVKEISLREALEICFKDQPLTYNIRGKNVIIKSKNDSFPENKVNESVPLLMDIKGRVLNENNDPVAGVTVMVKGTKVGTATDGEGLFQLKSIEHNATLVLTAVNILSKEINVNGRRELDLVVVGKSGKLDEVQVIAYGQTSQRFNTGNVATVKAIDIEKQPVQNPLLALQGRIPGLVITQTTGLNNGYVSVRIQGQNSIRNHANEPLIIIDGIPYPSVLPPDGNGSPISGTNPLVGASPLSFINPADIESIDVLKDADATAIYGSRAANGAILITTKRAKAGNTKIDFRLQHGWGKVTRKIDMLNTRQYLDMRYEAYKNDGISLSSLTPGSRTYDLTLWDTTRYTDWQETLIGGTAQYNNYNASVSGGTATMQYLVSGTYDKTTDVFPGDMNDQRGAVHFNLGANSVNQRFKMQMSGNYMYDVNGLPGVDLTQKALLFEPVAPPIYNPDGSLNWAPNAAGTSTWENPLIYTQYREYIQTTKNLFSNIQLGYSILPDLEIKSSFGYSNLQSNSFVSSPLEFNKPEDRPFVQRGAQHTYRTNTSWIIEPQVIYKKSVGKLKSEGLLGTTIQKDASEFVSMEGSGYSSDLLLRNISSASSVRASTSGSVYRYNALFGRLNLNWGDKYIMNLSARRDGSSRFGSKNRFHNFGSIGVAWIFSQENLIQKSMPFVSFGKLRGSFGTTGHDQIGDYSYLNLYSSIFASIPYQGTTSMGVVGLPNPYLQWEETRKWNGGIDLGFLNNKILLNATFSYNRCSNQLLAYSLPDITGFPVILQNFPATVRNTSWEFMMTTTNMKTKDMFWTSSFNLTIPRNKLVAFPNIETTGYASGDLGVIVGQPIGVTKVFNYSGIDPNTGLYLINNKGGNPTASPDFSKDRTVLLSTAPRLYGGFQNNISFKGIQLDFLIQFVRQLDQNAFYYYNHNRAPGSFFRGLSNQPTSVLNRWQKPGDNSQIARFNSTNSVNSYVVIGSDAAYSYDASFVRLKNVSLSWKIPASWLESTYLQTGKVFFQGQNLFTITKYSGLDPENKSFTSLPPLQMWTVGIQLGF